MKKMITRPILCLIFFFGLFSISPSYSIPAKIAKQFVGIDDQEGTGLQLYLNEKDLIHDISQGDFDLKLFFDGRALLREKTYPQNIKVEIHTIIEGKKSLHTILNRTIKNAKAAQNILLITTLPRIEKSEQLQVEIYDTHNVLHSTYLENVEVSRPDGTIDIDLTNVPNFTCEDDDGECLIEYLLRHVTFSANYDRNLKTEVYKNDKGRYFVNIPIKRGRRLKKNVRGFNVKGGGNGGSTANRPEDNYPFFENQAEAGFLFWDAARDAVRLDFENSNKSFNFKQDGSFQVNTDVDDGLVNIGAGTTNKAGLVFAPGSLTTTLIDGSIEFDGNDFYFTKGGVRSAFGTGSGGGTPGPPGPQGPAGPAGPAASGIDLSNGGFLNGVVSFIANGLMQDAVFNGSFQYRTGAANGLVLTSDANGNATWDNVTILVNSTVLSTGPIGAVQFSGVSNGFDHDAANFFWDNAANSLGLGNNTPSARLDIEVANTENVTGLEIRQFDTTNNPAAVVIENDGSNHALVIQQDGQLAANDRGLRVYSNTAQTVEGLADVWLANGASTQEALLVRNDGNGNILELSDDGNLVMVVANGGNVGVGFVNPQASLDINGSIAIRDGSEADGFVLSSDANGDATWQDFESIANGLGLASSGPAGAVQFSDGANGFASDSTNFFWDDLNNRLGLGTNTPDNLITLSNGSTTLKTALDNNGMYFARTFDGFYSASITRGNGSTTHALDIDYDTNQRHTFKIGGVPVVKIGTTPHTVHSNGILSIDNISQLTNIDGLANSAVTITSDDATGSSLGIVLNRTNRSPANNNSIVNFQFNGNEAARITTAGNFGLGFEAPSAKLDINGSIAIRDGSEADGFVLSSDANGNATWQDFESLANGLGLGAAGAVGAIQFSDGANGFLADSPNLVWDDLNDRLGIGTNTPDSDLHVHGRFTRFDGNGNDTIVRIDSGSLARDSELRFTNTADRMAVYKPTSTNDLRITSLNAGVDDSITVLYNNGNVGIQTIAPSVELEVNGRTLISTNNGNFAPLTIAETANGHTANLTEWVDNGANVIANIEPDGESRFRGSRIGLDANAPYIFSFDNTANTVPVDAGRGLSFFSYQTAGNSRSFAFAGNTQTFTSGVSNHIYVSRIFMPASGSGRHNLMTLGHTIDQSGGATGITRTLEINPTLIGAADFRGIEFSEQLDNGHFAIYQASANARSFFNGQVGIGINTPDANLDVNGSFQYTDGSQANGFVLTSDANGNATWQAASTGALSSGVAGTVQFSDGVGGFDSNGRFFWDDANERFEIDGGDIRFPNGGTIDAANNQSLTIRNVNNNGRIYLDSREGVDVDLRSKTSGIFRVSQPNGALLTVDSASQGIILGKASLAADRIVLKAADTSGGSHQGNDLVVRAGDSGTGATDGGDLYLLGGKTGGSGSNGNVILVNNGNETIGNVGIGFTLPTARLDLNGTIAIRDGSEADGFVLTSDANGLASWQALAAGGDITSVGDCTSGACDDFTLTASGAGVRPLAIRAAVGQTANLQEWQNGGGSVVASINENGVLTMDSFEFTTSTSNYTPNTGWHMFSPTVMIARMAGANQFKIFNSGGIETQYINFGAGSNDAQLRNDGSNTQTMAQRRGTQAQTFRIYNTYTSSTNFERVGFSWNGDDFRILSENGSTGGTQRNISISSPLTTINGNFQIIDGTEANGFVLTSDANGLASWQAASTGAPSVGAAGALQFSDGAGAFSADATNIFWDDTNNRLGIGTNTPASNLHVYENNALNGNTIGATLEQDGTGDTSLSFLLTGTRRWVAGVDNSDGDKFKIANTEFLDTDTQMTIDNSGRTGFGISGPQSKVHIYQDSANVAGGAGLTVEQDGTGDPVVQYLTTGARRWVTGIDNDDNDAFKISSSVILGSDDIIEITTGGFVGIDAATPDSDLDVGDGVRNFIDGNEDILVADDIEVDGDLYVGGLISGTINGLAASGAAGAIQFSDGAGAFDSNGRSFSWDNVNGQLGIGTDTPSYPIDIVSSSVHTNGLRLESSAQNLTIRLENHVAEINASHRLRLEDSSNIVFDSDGGDASIQPSMPRGLLIRPISNNYVGLEIRASGSQVDNLQEWQDNSANILSLIDNSGLMAINKATIDRVNGASLDVNGSIFATGLRMQDGGQANGFVLTSDANGVASWQAASSGGSSSNGALGAVQFSDGTGGFSSNGNTFVWDDANGYLGISDAVPEAPIHILGTDARFLVERSGGQWVRFSSGTVGSAFKYSNTGNFSIGPVALKTDSSIIDDFYMDANGDIGLSTTDPTAKFEVNGTTIIDGLIASKRSFPNTSGAAVTVDWNEGNRQEITLGHNVTFTFTDPSPASIANLTLFMIQDGTGSRLATWPANVRWSGGTAPTLTTTAGQMDIVSCVFRSPNYYCQAALDFTP